MRRVAVAALVVVALLALTVPPATAATPSFGAKASGGDAVKNAETPEAPAKVVKEADAKADKPSKPKPAASAPKKKKKKAKKKKEKPVEIVDLMLDVGGNMCEKLGKLVKRKRFSAEKRCDLLKFCIEDLASMFDAMANELEMTQMDMVNNALQQHHWMTFQMNMKKVVKMVLAEAKPSEKMISDELHKTMSQWILNVATGQSANSGGGVGKLSREAQKNLRSMGIGLPSYGQLDDDDLDEETALIGDDYQWAEASNAAAAAYDEDDDDDDDDL